MRSVAGMSSLLPHRQVQVAGMIIQIVVFIWFDPNHRQNGRRNLILRQEIGFAGWRRICLRNDLFLHPQIQAGGTVIYVVKVFSRTRPNHG